MRRLEKGPKRSKHEARCAVKFRRHLATNVAKGKSLRKVARVIPSLFRMRNVPGMGRLCVRCTFMICSQREFLNSIELTICVGVLDDDDDDLKIWWLDKINAITRASLVIEIYIRRQLRFSLDWNQGKFTGKKRWLEFIFPSIVDYLTEKSLSFQLMTKFDRLFVHESNGMESKKRIK